MAASNPSSSTSQRHLSGPPAMPIARQPLMRAICPTLLPTDPAAPDTTTVSPGSGLPTSSSPKYAVRPLIPRTPRCTGAGASVVSTCVTPLPSDTA